MTTHEHTDIVKRWFYDLFAQANFAAIHDLVTPDFVSYDPRGRFMRSLNRERKWWFGIPGLTTYRGGLLGIPSKNQRVTEMGILIFHLREGKICELCSALCDLDLVLALGAVPVLKEE